MLALALVIIVLGAYVMHSHGALPAQLESRSHLEVFWPGVRGMSRRFVGFLINARTLKGVK